MITHFYTLYIYIYIYILSVPDLNMLLIFTKSIQYELMKLCHKITFKKCDLTLPLNVIPGQYLYAFLVKHKHRLVNYILYYNSLLNPVQLRHNISIIHSSSHPSMLQSFMVSLSVYSCASG